MARRGRARADRDTSDIASLLAPPRPLPRAHYVTEFATEDRREYHPEGPFAAPLSFGNLPAAISWTGTLSGSTPSPSKRISGLPTGSLIGSPAFTTPPGVAICVRRKQRREVLHALKKTRSGSGRSKRRNPYSEVKC